MVRIPPSVQGGTYQQVSTNGDVSATKTGLMVMKDGKPTFVEPVDQEELRMYQQEFSDGVVNSELRIGRMRDREEHITAVFNEQINRLDERKKTLESLNASPEDLTQVELARQQLIATYTNDILAAISGASRHYPGIRAEIQQPRAASSSKAPLPALSHVSSAGQNLSAPPAHAPGFGTPVNSSAYQQQQQQQHHAQQHRQSAALTYARQTAQQFRARQPGRNYVPSQQQQAVQQQQPPPPQQAAFQVQVSPPPPTPAAAASSPAPGWAPGPPPQMHLPQATQEQMTQPISPQQSLPQEAAAQGFDMFADPIPAEQSAGQLMRASHVSHDN